MPMNLKKQTNGGMRECSVPPDEVGVDIAQVACLPDTHFEAVVHTEMDRISDMAATEPLKALGAAIGVMQGLNAELFKSYAPAVVSNAQMAATEALTTGKPVAVSKEQARAIQTLMRVQESITKLGVARVKVADEKARRHGTHSP